MDERRLIRDMAPEVFTARCSPGSRGGARARGRPRDPPRLVPGTRSARLRAPQAHQRDRAEVRFLFTEDVGVDPGGGRRSLPRRARDLRSRAIRYACCSRCVDAWDDRGLSADASRDARMKPKQVFQALRVAVSGEMVSLPLFESLALLGRERTLARLKSAQSMAAP